MADRGGLTGKIMAPIMFLGREAYENVLLPQQEEARREATREWTSKNMKRLVEYARYVSSIDPELLSSFFDHLATKTPEELEAIYGSSLDVLKKDRTYVAPNSQ